MATTAGITENIMENTTGITTREHEKSGKQNSK